MQACKRVTNSLRASSQQIETEQTENRIVPYTSPVIQEGEKCAHAPWKQQRSEHIKITKWADEGIPLGKKCKSPRSQENERDRDIPRVSFNGLSRKKQRKNAHCGKQGDIPKLKKIHADSCSLMQYFGEHFEGMMKYKTHRGLDCEAWSPIR